MRRPLPPLAINGKFLAAAPTGVHRVAAELASALAVVAQEQPEALDIEVWIPRDATEAARAIKLPTRVIAPFTHIPWEQLSIPLRDPSRLLLNLCNIGPVLRGNAMTMIHDAQVYLTPDSYSRAFRLWYKGLQPLLGQRNRHILTVSHYSRSEIARVGLCPEERIGVVHNGVDHMLNIARQPDIMARLALEQQRFVVALASTQAHKNIRLLARAFHDSRLSDLRLVLVGSTPLAEFAANGISLPPATILTGRISDGELRALYESALCIAFPSMTEGFGLPPMEAMLLGCPAIIAPCGALPEVCGDAALTADPGDPEPWIRHIRALADDPMLRDRFSRLGKTQASRFTWRAAAEQLLGIIAEVTAPPNDAPIRTGAPERPVDLVRLPDRAVG